MTETTHEGPRPTTGSTPVLDGPTPGAPARMAPRDRLAVGLLLFSAFVVILNETVMGVAIPELMRSLAIDAAQAQWITTAFMLTMAVVIPVTGFVMQRTTTRRVFIGAMSLFSLGTLVSALSPGFEVLLVGRVVQATGTAIMMPLLMTTVMTVTPPSSRGRTMGNIAVVMSVAPAVGPTVSGLVLSVLEWRWLFVFVLPIALGALALGAARLPDLGEPSPAKVHVLSIIVSALGFGGLVYGLVQFSESPTAVRDLSTWVPVLVGAAALSFFVALQLWLQRTDRALLDLRTFRSPTFSVAVVLMAVMMISLFGTIILLPLYAQNVLDLEVLASGLMLLPGSLLMGLAAPWVGRAYDRVGPRALLLPGAVLVSVAAWAMTLLGTRSAVWHVIGAHVVLSVGLALVFTPLFSSALGSLPGRLYAHGSAVVGTVQQVAGAAGIALFITVMTLGTLRERPRLDEVAATAAGVHDAFLIGAVLSLVAIPLTLGVRATSPGEVDGPEPVPAEAPEQTADSEQGQDPERSAEQDPVAGVEPVTAVR